MADSLKKWHIVLGVILLAGIIAVYGISVWGNHSVSNTYYIPAGVFSPLPQQSVVIPTTRPVVDTLPAACIPDNLREYQVIGGKPFTYTGSVHDNTTPSIGITSSTLMNPYPSVSQRPVDPYGKFSFSITGNATQGIWDEHSSGKPGIGGDPSPYEHLCIGYPTGTECFDLRVVGDTTNLTGNQHNDWIRIDPIPDPVISENDRMGYTGNFFINGTTNSPPGEQVRLVVGSQCFLPCPKTSASNNIGCCGSNSYESEATVQEGPCGINTWSVFVNTTPDRFTVTSLNGKYDVNEFLVIATQVNRTKDDNRWDASHFKIRVR